MPALSENASLLGKVEKLAVEDNAHFAGFVAERLPPIAQADNAQTPRRQPDARPHEIAVFVGAAMDQRARHRTQGAHGDWTFAGEIDHARDAAHGLPLRTLFR